MQPVAKVVQATWMATIVKRAERGARQFGVPYGGPFDPDAVDLLHTLLGSPTDCRSLEFVGGTATIEWTAQSTVAWFGPQGMVSHEGKNVAPWTVWNCERGDLTRVQPSQFGYRGWIVAEGGLAPSAGPIKQGSVLAVGKRAFQRTRSFRFDGHVLPTGPIRYIPTETFKRFSLRGSYMVDHRSNRVGVRLTRPEGLNGLPVVSTEPMTMGSIECTPQGELIILGPEGPTTGGYPQVGAVARVDWGKVAQLTPNSIIELEPITLQEARKMWADTFATKQKLASFRP